jgi:7-keto-8-aminopelargonate synthetase-like enzyme
MSHDQLSGNTKLPAPCIVDTGLVINKQDMQRLLSDLSRVRYVYSQDGQVLSEGEGYVLEVFSDPQRSTLVANHTLYINVCSFDYLELRRSPEQEARFDLVQDTLQLRLIPLSNPLQEQTTRCLNAAALEAVVAEVLSAGWDVRIDDEENFPL